MNTASIIMIILSTEIPEKKNTFTDVMLVVSQ